MTATNEAADLIRSFAGLPSEDWGRTKRRQLTRKDRPMVVNQSRVDPDIIGALILMIAGGIIAAVLGLVATSHLEAIRRADVMEQCVGNENFSALDCIQIVGTL